MSDPEQNTDVMPSLDEVPIDDLDRKLLDVFAGRVVRKDLVKKLKVGFNVPVYVLEYLLGKFCSTTNRSEIETGLRQVKDTITERIVRADLQRLHPAPTLVAQTQRRTLAAQTLVRRVEIDGAQALAAHGAGTERLAQGPETVRRDHELHLDLFRRGSRGHRPILGPAVAPSATAS